MEKIPSAEVFLDQYLHKSGIPWSPEIEKNYGAIHTAMIEFVKLHVKAALKAASDKARSKGTYKSNEGHLIGGGVDKKSITEAYSLENIK
jgi:hypothetical protein